MGRFIRDEGGLALTEYLVLLALLTSGVLASVGLYGGALGDRIAGWGSFLSAVLPDPSGEGDAARTYPAVIDMPEAGPEGTGPLDDQTGPATETASDGSGRKCASTRGQAASQGRSAVSCR